jgi:hypothetical protein
MSIYLYVNAVRYVLFAIGCTAAPNSMTKSMGCDYRGLQKYQRFTLLDRSESDVGDGHIGSLTVGCGHLAVVSSGLTT